MHDDKDIEKSEQDKSSGIERFGNLVLNATRAVAFILLIMIGWWVAGFYFN